MPFGLSLFFGAPCRAGHTCFGRESPLHRRHGQAFGQGSAVLGGESRKQVPPADPLRRWERPLSQLARPPHIKALAHDSNNCPREGLFVYKIGAIAVPLFSLFGIEALEYRLADRGARAVITDFAAIGAPDPLRTQIVKASGRSFVACCAT